MARSRFVLGLCVLAMAVSNLAHAQSLSHDPRSHGAPATPRSSGLRPAAPRRSPSRTDPVQRGVATTPSSCNTSPRTSTRPTTATTAGVDDSAVPVGVDGDFDVCNVTDRRRGRQRRRRGRSAADLRGQPRVHGVAAPFRLQTPGTLVGTADVHAPGPGTLSRAVGSPVTATLPAGSALVGRMGFDASGLVRQQRTASSAPTRGTRCAPSYIKAASCGISSPVTIASVGFADRDIVMSRSRARPPDHRPDGPRGRHDRRGQSERCPRDGRERARSFRPGTTATPTPSTTVSGTVSDFSGPAGANYVVDDGWPATARSRQARTPDCDDGHRTAIVDARRRENAPRSALRPRS